MRLAEAAVLEDAEAGEAGDHRAPEKDRSRGAAGRDLQVARQRDEASDDGDQADGGVDRAERCQAEHVNSSLWLDPACPRRVHLLLCEAYRFCRQDLAFDEG